MIGLNLYRILFRYSIIILVFFRITIVKTKEKQNFNKAFSFIMYKGRKYGEGPRRIGRKTGGELDGGGTMERSESRRIKIGKNAGTEAWKGRGREGGTQRR